MQASQHTTNMPSHRKKAQPSLQLGYKAASLVTQLQQASGLCCVVQRCGATSLVSKLAIVLDTALVFRPGLWSQPTCTPKMPRSRPSMDAYSCCLSPATSVLLAAAAAELAATTRLLQLFWAAARLLACGSWVV